MKVIMIANTYVVFIMCPGLSYTDNSIYNIVTYNDIYVIYYSQQLHKVEVITCVLPMKKLGPEQTETLFLVVWPVSGA